MTPLGIQSDDALKIRERNVSFDEGKIQGKPTFCIALIAARIEVCCTSILPKSSLNNLSWFFKSS